MSAATAIPTPCSVYLDEHFLRVRHPTYRPKYKLAIMTVLPINPEDIMGHVDEIFTTLNVGTPHKELADEWRAKGHRSLSVGDVVVIGEMAYRCEPESWRVIDPAEITANTP